MNNTVDKIFTTTLKVINLTDGNVMHGLKKIDHGYVEFGEAYFSFIKLNKIKAWKKHKKMQLNLIIPKGEVLFVFFDDEGNFREEKIGESNKARITVPPGIWFGFKGLYKKESIILNISNIIHDDKEVLRKNLNEIKYDWNLI